MLWRQASPLRRLYQKMRVLSYWGLLLALTVPGGLVILICILAETYSRSHPASSQTQETGRQRLDLK